MKAERLGGARRTQVVVTAAVLFAVVFVLRLALPDPESGLLFLSIVPIALLAVEFRLVGGLVGAGIGIVLLAVWLATMDVDLAVTGLVTRILTFVLVGVGVGLASRSRAEQDARLSELHRAEERHRAALKIHDEIVQGLAVAKLALEMEDRDRADAAIDRALASARSVVTEGVARDVGSLRAPEHGGVATD